MKETFLNIKNQLSRKFGGHSRQSDFEEPVEEEYVELAQEIAGAERNRIIVRPFVMEEFEDIKPILDALRQGLTIALINIAPLKEKDIVELKRAVNKLKKTCDAIDGDIAGFGEDYIVATPEFASVFRPPSQQDDITQ
ncbi:MAG: cell division protein SepF [Nanoarchaeota archaeon]|nr:cell division protein SepF [Nanoarchaeota archaeon]